MVLYALLFMQFLPLQVETLVLVMPVICLIIIKLKPSDLNQIVRSILPSVSFNTKRK